MPRPRVKLQSSLDDYLGLAIVKEEEKVGEEDEREQEDSENQQDNTSGVSSGALSEATVETRKRFRRPWGPGQLEQSGLLNRIRPLMKKTKIAKPKWTGWKVRKRRHGIPAVRKRHKTLAVAVLETVPKDPNTHN